MGETAKIVKTTSETLRHYDRIGLCLLYTSDVYKRQAGEIVEQDVGETLRKNYMPYAMSVILSRAIPEKMCIRDSCCCIWESRLWFC